MINKLLDFLGNNNTAIIASGVILTFIVSVTTLYFTVKNNQTVHYVNSITKSRAEWVNALRKNLSVFFSMLNIENTFNEYALINELKEYNYYERIDEMSRISTEIILYFNYADKFDEDIVNGVKQLGIIYRKLLLHVRKQIIESDSQQKNFIPGEELKDILGDLETVKQEFIQLIQIYFKVEWERIKDEAAGKKYEAKTYRKDRENLVQLYNYKQTERENFKNAWKRNFMNSIERMKRILCEHSLMITILIVVFCIFLIGHIKITIV